MPPKIDDSDSAPPNACFGTPEGVRDLLARLPRCACCDEPATVEFAGVPTCDLHSGHQAVESPSTPIIRVMIRRASRG